MFSFSIILYLYSISYITKFLSYSVYFRSNWLQSSAAIHLTSRCLFPLVHFDSSHLSFSNFLKEIMWVAYQRNPCLSDNVFLLPSHIKGIFTN